MKKLLCVCFSCVAILSCLHAQIGRVGINTAIPAAMLHVKDSSVLFTGTNSLPATPGNPPASDAGTRLMWYPDKAAFRAGRVTGSEWNKQNTGNHSVGFGLNSIASGSQSTAMGDNTIASGAISTAIGNNTIASGYSSTAMGLFCTASGFIGSTATGFNTQASGDYSISMGRSTNAVGSISAAMGFFTKARPYASLVIGRYNDTTAISTTIWEDNDPVFIIGNGAGSNSRNNAMTVLKSGNTGIGAISPQRLLHLRRGSSGSSFHSRTALIIEDNDAAYLQFATPANEENGILSSSDASSLRSALIFRADSSVQIRSGGNNTKLLIHKTGNIAFGNFPPTFRLHLNLDSAAKPTSNTWTVSSDARLKRNILDYTAGLNEILKIHPVWFTYNGEAGMPEDTGVGVIAQELESIAPYMVGSWDYTDDDGNATSYLTVNNGPMTYMLINAVKEQQKIIEKLLERIEVLEKRDAPLAHKLP